MIMVQVHSDVIQFRGPHYEFGYAQGKRLLRSPVVTNRIRQWNPENNLRFFVDEEDFLTAIFRWAPQIWQEIRGLRDALSMDTPTAIRLFGGFYDGNRNSGCSIFAIKNFLARNYDNDPLSYEGRYVFYQPDDSGYATLGPSMQITGRTDGMNEKGLVMGYNFTNRKNSGTGFVCNMIGRIILETCASVPEAVRLLKQIPHRHSFSYVLLDSHHSPVIVEASPQNVAVRPGNVCTNHFERLTEENRYRTEDSERRIGIMKKYEDRVTSSYEAYQLLNDPAYGVFSENYGAWAGTIHTVMYVPQTLKAWFAHGSKQKPVIFDFRRWLEGNDTPVTRIKGKLNAKHGFVNLKEYRF